MYGISSSLASQTINKITAWNCLVSLGKVSGTLTKFMSDRMIVEGWGVGVRVVIKRGYKGIEVFKGLSTIISPLKIALQMMEQTCSKSVKLNVIRKSERLFLVDSFQDPSIKHVVSAQFDGLTCSCMKFKCLKSRMEKEAPQLLKALGQVSLLDGSKVYLTEHYDLNERTIEEKVHLQCHHIRAVMREFFDAFTFQEYLWNWKKVINSYRYSQDNRMSDEEWNESLFPVDNWGEFKRKTS
ncbi:hypothetical protein [Brasilonema sp. UFV-L1]|uniref:hypothetical protein n=1 Tax=Brasilonema sp. UFV-L1 TaxID=2234130 RepID=UPI00145D7485|nr:hypothetical protein [Brasilonema sp. UFV-L1]